MGEETEHSGRDADGSPAVIPDVKGTPRSGGRASASGLQKARLPLGPTPHRLRLPSAGSCPCRPGPGPAAAPDAPPRRRFFVAASEHPAGAFVRDAPARRRALRAPPTVERDAPRLPGDQRRAAQPARRHHDPQGRGLQPPRRARRREQRRLGYAHRRAVRLRRRHLPRRRPRLLPTHPPAQHYPGEAPPPRPVHHQLRQPRGVQELGPRDERIHAVRRQSPLSRHLSGSFLAPLPGRPDSPPAPSPLPVSHYSLSAPQRTGGRAAQRRPPLFTQRRRAPPETID